MKNQILLSAFLVMAIGFLQKTASGQANTSLSNLAATTAVNSHLLPQSNNSKNFGSTASSWMNVYLDGILFIDDVRFLSNTGAGNSLIGANAGLAITTGTYNTYTGENSGRFTTTGYSNSFYGQSAGYTNTTGFLNTFVGRSAGYSNNGSYNTGVGASALLTNSSGSNNSALGFNALALNTTGIMNTALGSNALENNTYGEENTAVGYGALNDNVGGFKNTAVGFEALENQASTFFNTAIGHSALWSLNSGDNNTALGAFAMVFSLNATNNTAVGAGALITSDGSDNTALGRDALNLDETGIGNTGVGANADVSGTGLSNATAIGYNTTVDVSNKVRIGNSSVTSNGGQVSWTAYSDGRIKSSIQENVPGLNFIKELRPVTYHFDIKKQNDLLGISDSLLWEGKYDIEKIQWTGFIAQEVEAAANKIQYDFSGVDKSGEILGLRYAEFVVPLVKAVQELSEENVSLQTENSALEARLTKLEALVNETRNSLVMGEQIQSVKLLNEGAALGQNIPNPFNGKTKINYFVPESVTSAKIVFSTQNGIEVYSTEINPGAGYVEIDATQLVAGNYIYNLFIDGNIIDSKQMVFVK